MTEEKKITKGLQGERLEERWGDKGYMPRLQQRPGHAGALDTCRRGCRVLAQNLHNDPPWTLVLGGRSRFLGE